MIGFLARYPTYRIFLTAVLTLVATAALAPFWIRLLKVRNIGQIVRADGPTGHLTKEGTPTMGGVLILVTVTGASVLMGRITPYVVVALFTMLACGTVGFFDDYSSVVRARSLGLKARSKLFWQLVISVTTGLLAVNYAHVSTSVIVPLSRLSIPLGSPSFSLSLGGAKILVPVLYLLLLFVVVAGFSNAVNLTDGLDGLAAGTVTIIMLAYAGIAFRQNRLDVALFCAAVAGSCIGFLWYNSFPADIFMGDTGSLGLGGAIAALAILTRTELLLGLIGGIYVIEACSVIAQVLSFRYLGRRILRMAPIHHHFEMIGWSETKIMVRFWIITGVLAGGGFAIYFVSRIRS
ncbi:MAG: phospho-N-acetylmuramoyl-pentapeptide-transferase [Actinobacteria bacterium]|jgi:phospho-N-acetylmuramoyl-pentapeptide-transferase|nr:MAG: phospho-N-acetylmuramoyl-pentapeptide-transferase [Actinomycetota bacterium]